MSHGTRRLSTASTDPPSAGLLRASGRRLLDRLSASESLAEAEMEAATEDVWSLVSAVETVLGGRDPETVRRALTPRARRHGLVGALRRAVLQEAASTGSDSGAVETLWALERLGPAPPVTGDEPSSMQALIQEPDAYRLLREVAHDMRSPLTSILFLAGALRSSLPDGETGPQRSQVGLIYSAALALQTVVQDVVDLGRAGFDLDEDPGPLSVATLFRNLEDLVGPMAEEKGVELRFIRPDADPVLGHRHVLGRILLNLTTNALKFTDQGTVRVEARRVDPETMELSVQDTGPGISTEQRDTLFQPFKKTDERRGHFFSSSGLGLTIARRMIRTLGSELECESEPGRGTRFHFRVCMPPFRQGG